MRVRAIARIKGSNPTTKHATSARHSLHHATTSLCRDDLPRPTSAAHPATPTSPASPSCAIASPRSSTASLHGGRAPSSSAPASSASGASASSAPAVDPPTADPSSCHEGPSSAHHVATTATTGPIRGASAHAASSRLASSNTTTPASPTTSACPIAARADSVPRGSPRQQPPDHRVERPPRLRVQAQRARNPRVVRGVGDVLHVQRREPRGHERGGAPEPGHPGGLLHAPGRYRRRACSATLRPAMARFIDELKRTHHCGALRAQDQGQIVVLFGWVAGYRDHGGCVFIDLRDREGITQLVFDPELSGHGESPRQAYELARALRNEWVVGIRGVVVSRGSNKNPKLAHRRDRGARHRAGRLQQERDAALRDRRRHRHRRGEAPAVPLPRPSPRARSSARCACGTA